MKYVSPIYEVETIETEDIMGASMVAIAESLGITVSGENRNDAVTSVTLTDSEGNKWDEETSGEAAASGVSIGINFGSLFGNN
ncbi:MAG: hypothetical protein J6C61_00860 [Clostridia bacterium]|nr:hypothetical protein [Clostridia bacterium]